MHKYVIENDVKGQPQCYIKDVDGIFRDFKTPKLFHFEPRNAGQKLAMAVCLSNKYVVRAIEGEVGTGKSFIAILAGIQRMLNGEFRHVIYSRPPAPTQFDMGFLPGTEEEKFAPWVGAFYDQIELIQDRRLEALLKERPDAIMAMPMDKIKGRTLRNAYVIIDEAQDTLPETMRMLIGRPDEGTEITVCGDRHQIDAPGCNADWNGLIAAEWVNDEPDVAFVTLTEPVRSRAAEIAAKLGKKIRAIKGLGRLPHGAVYPSNPNQVREVRPMPPLPQPIFNMPIISEGRYILNGPQAAGVPYGNWNQGMPIFNYNFANQEAEKAKSVLEEVVSQEGEHR